VSDGNPYLYPGTHVLRNKFGLLDASALDGLERALVSDRIAEGVPEGDFDLDHLRAIHRHLFQDIYDWAGEIRTVEISKGGSRFQFRRYIATGMADIHRRIVRWDYLRGLAPEAFAGRGAEILGDVNHVHPFREGNGRAQSLYFSQLAARAGHPLDLTRLRPRAWIAASKAANRGEYGPMAAELLRAAAPKRR
jgi:cell filamentation protein